jgi:hypothetical protein
MVSSARRHDHAMDMSVLIERGSVPQIQAWIDQHGHDVRDATGMSIGHLAIRYGRPGAMEAWIHAGGDVAASTSQGVSIGAFLLDGGYAFVSSCEIDGLIMEGGPSDRQCDGVRNAMRIWIGHGGVLVPDVHARPDMCVNGDLESIMDEISHDRHTYPASIITMAACQRFLGCPSVDPSDVISDMEIQTAIQSDRYAYRSAMGLLPWLASVDPMAMARWIECIGEIHHPGIEGLSPSS